ncbi:MAG: MBL fold metallo-hydrolase [Acidobacteria bacterium]|nr:MAG: MBL fold metallo-hydrolase [Acidobacteriota bacterium]
MMPLGPGLDYFDLNFIGMPGVIAAGLLHGRSGVALVDPGPTTCLATLKSELAIRGLSTRDIRWILLTHIHLDHAAATGSLVAECPKARVIVHERGAPHLIDPSKLLASATRLYGADMERLWGEIRPVPAANIDVVGDSARMDIAGHDVDIAYTPGHAWHHISFFLRDARVAFVGDTAGICRPSGRLVLPPTPPPDIDLEAWRISTERILSWNPDVLFLTHFGPQAAPRVHFHDMWKRMDDWSAKVQASLIREGTDEERARQFDELIVSEISQMTTDEEAKSYARAGRFDFSWTGLARYWRKKNAVK